MARARQSAPDEFDGEVVDAEMAEDVYEELDPVQAQQIRDSQSY